MASKDKIFLTVHGHFYQPPRENPWLDAIELQDSALTAAAHGHIDRIVSYADARKYIIAGFEMFF